MEESGCGEDQKVEYNCPFCAEDFDFVGFCCHVDDEHAAEVKSGICPICTSVVGEDLVGHMAIQHVNYFTMQRRRKIRKFSSGSNSLLYLLRRDLRDGNLQAIFGGSSNLGAPPAGAPDHFTSSLIYTFSEKESSRNMHISASESAPKKFSDEKALERVERCLSEIEYKERTRRSAFMQELVLWTVFYGNL